MVHSPVLYSRKTRRQGKYARGSNRTGCFTKNFSMPTWLQDFVKCSRRVFKLTKLCIYEKIIKLCYSGYMVMNATTRISVLT